MKKCSINKCDEKHVANGLCGAHYYQSRRGIKISEMTTINKREGLYDRGLKCKVKNCKRDAQRALMCMAHYQRVQKYGNPMENKPITEIKGWHYHKTGYIVVPANGHPNGNKAGSIMEHIKIMSEHICRPLIKGENVHHKNGIRDDNKLSNLELWAKPQPKGARVKDLIIYAKNIISLYGNDETKF